MSEWLPVSVGLRHGCAMSSWLFNLHMDGAVRVVNARMLGIRLELVGVSRERFEIKHAIIVYKSHSTIGLFRGEIL